MREDGGSWDDETTAERLRAISEAAGKYGRAKPQCDCPRCRWDRGERPPSDDIAPAEPDVV